MPRGVRGSVFRPARTHTYPEPAEHAFHSAAYLPGKIDCANLVPLRRRATDLARDGSVSGSTALLRPQPPA